MRPRCSYLTAKRTQKRSIRWPSRIQELGYTIWIDRQSTGSNRYAGKIVNAIRSSKIVALMCSQNSFATDHVTREVYVAGDYKKHFIAFQLDQTEIPDELHYFLTGFPRVPLPIEMQQLRAEMVRLLGRDIEAGGGHPLQEGSSDDR